METQNSNPRYVIVNSKRFIGYYDILDTQTGRREPTSTQSMRFLKLEVKDLNRKQEQTMNEFKYLTDEQIEQLYNETYKATLNLSPLMAINDRLYLIQRQKKLREEWIKRKNGQ